MTETQERNAKLVAALRSGEFQQVRGALKFYTAKKGEVEGHCCLGVACEVFRQETGEGSWECCGEEKEREASFHVPQEGSFDKVPPPVVREWFGWSKGLDPILIDSIGLHTNATTMNDRDRHSFKEIADAFERTYVLPKPEGQ